MSAETGLYALLKADAGVLALVSTRIYPNAMPEETAYPAVTFIRATTAPIETIHGSYFGNDITLIVSIWATSRAGADTVADAIESALVGTDYRYTDRTAEYSEEFGLHGTAITVETYQA